ncbi:hypothetical protein [Microcoleus sp.]|uniref:hypothetical protein n=1 Tax=Microcoleus sp. TaxID=44472 RepID=UPI003592FCDC
MLPAASRISNLNAQQLATNGLLEIAFEHWFSIPYFYEKLTDGEPEAVLIFY